MFPAKKPRSFSHSMGTSSLGITRVHKHKSIYVMFRVQSFNKSSFCNIREMKDIAKQTLWRRNWRYEISKTCFTATHSSPYDDQHARFVITTLDTQAWNPGEHHKGSYLSSFYLNLVSVFENTYIHGCYTVIIVLPIHVEKLFFAFSCSNLVLLSYWLVLKWKLGCTGREKIYNSTLHQFWFWKTQQAVPEMAFLFNFTGV